MSLHARSTAVVLLISFCLALTAACNLSDSPDKTIKRYIRAVERGDIDAAMKCFTGRFVLQLGPEKARAVLSDMTLQTKKRGGVASISIDKQAIVGDIAELTFTVKYGNGNVNTTTMKLVKESGKWKIQT